MLSGRHWDFRAGAPTPAFSAEDWPRLADALEARHSPRVVAPLSSPAPGVVDFEGPPGFYARLSGASSPYGFAEVQGAAGGGWIPRVSSGAANAYEVNGVAGLAGKVVWLEPGYSGSPADYRFQWACECGTSPPPPPPPPVTIPGCTCTATPESVSMSSSGPCVPSDFQACTIEWGPTPSQFSGLSLGSSCYLSTEHFQDPFTGGWFYYNLTCDTVFFRLSRVYEATEFGGAYHDAAIYTWRIGDPGNTCSPFLLSAGDIYPGGDNTCVVTIE